MSEQNNEHNSAAPSQPEASGAPASTSASPAASPQEASCAPGAGGTPQPEPAAAPTTAAPTAQAAASASASAPQAVPPAPAGWRSVPPSGAGYAPYAAAPVAAPPQKKSRAWIVALVAVVLVFVLIAMGMHSCTSLFTSSMGYSTSASDAVDALTQDAVAVITIDGTIQYDGTASSPEGLKSLLDEAEASPHIRAVVLRVDSGGGVATAGEEMAEYLSAFSKPVVVSSASTNASAAYEISSQADYIFTAKSTSIGAIGTAIQITDTSELMDMLGINIQDITSAGSKDSTYGTRPLTDEERAYYQDMVDQINEVFIQNVAEGRGMDVEEVRALATGLTFTGMDAVENGLADEIGTKEDAIEKAADLAGMTSYAVIELDQDTDELSAMLDLLSENDVSSDAVAEALKELYNDGTLAR